jgi:arginine-tRNA-protein transferase
MYPPSYQQFESFLTREWGLTHYYCFYAGEQLLGVAVVDVMDNGLSAIYTFYDPDHASRSLGVYAVLWQIEHCRALELPHVYLGYWIKQCRKMSYKINYRPTELLINNRWVSLT